MPIQIYIAIYCQINELQEIQLPKLAKRGPLTKGATVNEKNLETGGGRGAWKVNEEVCCFW